MTVFSSVWGILAISLIFLLHILSAVLPGIYGKIGKYVNIGLHIPLTALLVYLGAPIEEGAFIYLGSLFLYILFEYIRFRAEREDKR